MKKFTSEIYNRIDKKRVAFWISLLLIVMIIEISATIIIPGWRTYFFNGIEARKYEIFIRGLFYFVGISVTFATAQGFKLFIERKSGVLIREAIVEILKKRWFANIKNPIENADQRISEDSKHITECLLEVSVEVIISSAIVIGIMYTMIYSHLSLLFGSIIYTIIAGFIASKFYR